MQYKISKWNIFKPLAGVHTTEDGLQRLSEKFKVVKPVSYGSRQWKCFNCCIMDWFAQYLVFSICENGIQTCTETHFENRNLVKVFIQRTQTIPDKHVHAFLQRTIHGMVVFLQTVINQGVYPFFRCYN